MNGQRCYISGPMTGYPDHNYPAFNDAETLLEMYGWTVLNPARNFNGATDRKRSEYMRLDVKHVLNADAIFVLPGWERSRGSRVEILMAQELDIPVYTFMPNDLIVGANFVGVVETSLVNEKVVTYVR